MPRWRALVIVGLVALASCARGQVYTDPAQAGADFAVQGEYVGTTGEQALGAQVIALGNGSFRAVFYPGGLPGAGWDRSGKTAVDGHTAGEQVVIGGEGSGWSATIAAGQLAGRTPAGTPFALKKIERRSPTLGMKPPPGAIVLFDGNNTDAWINGRMTPDGLLQVGTTTREQFGDFVLHVEFRTPFRPTARGQARGNSGVYFNGRHEIQVLDSFGLEGRQNECGALYGIKAPDVNLCFPPLSWQTYDIEYIAARVDPNGRIAKKAIVTVRHNGVVVHDRVELDEAPGVPQRDGIAIGPIHLQNHGNPVHYRNLWLVERK